MKQIIIGYFLLLFLFTGCADKIKEKTFNISMQKINGEWITAHYKLPEDACFFIDTFRGSYSLRYDRRNSENWFNRNPSGRIIRNGIIDYKIKI